MRSKAQFGILVFALPDARILWTFSLTWQHRLAASLNIQSSNTTELADLENL